MAYKRPNREIKKKKTAKAKPLPEIRPAGLAANRTAVKYALAGGRPSSARTADELLAANRKKRAKNKMKKGK